MNQPDPVTRLNAALEGRYRIELQRGVERRERALATRSLQGD